MVSSLNPCAAAMLAKLWRRVWGVTWSKAAGVVEQAAERTDGASGNADAACGLTAPASLARLGSATGGNVALHVATGMQSTGRDLRRFSRRRDGFARSFAPCVSPPRARDEL
jgi:hypothetical protein